ncbi:MAG: hypothetical protein JWP63_4828 [Candidatus Solibacter sp.]|nr:hypothetical protein [Candidatus Solibacter sp.]
MRLLKMFAIAAFALAGTVEAQTSHGYVFLAPGGATANGYTAMTLNPGIGGEARIVPHIGAGAELAGLGFREDFSSSIMGVFSSNGYFHFNGKKGAKIDPYLTGGYTLFFRYGHANLGNFGGGVNIWPSKHVGVKLEARDHVTTRYETVHYWGVRVGVNFR